MSLLERYLTRAITWIAIGFFIGGTLLYSFQIMVRFFFQDSFFWIDALISYLFTLAALLGSALAVRSRENIKIDILRFYSEKPQVRIITDSFSGLVTIVLIMIFFSHTDRLFFSKTESIFGIQEWILNIPYLLLFLGSLTYYGRLLKDDIDLCRNSQRSNLL